VGGFDASVFVRLAGGRYVSIERSALARLIAARIDGRAETILGDSISGLSQNGEGVEVAFAKAPSRRFGLVVGADGLHSGVRELVFGPQAEFEHHLGYGVAAFEVAGYRPRDEGVYVSFSLPGRQVARFALRGDRTLILFVFAGGSDDRWPHDIAAQKAVLRRAFEAGGWECAPILTALDEAQELYFDRVSQIRMPRWSTGRVALLGDAAFCPSLLAGQGSALAMTAAYVLAGEIAREAAGPDSAFQRYEATLRDFMDGKQKAAEQFARSFAPRTRLGILARNLITRTFNLPFVAERVLGRGLIDRLALPHYDLPAQKMKSFAE
jgi:2-polyprenyl-6-methoxyphenol hydroxylase-like FAD-dependent oxidoreductase